MAEETQNEIPNETPETPADKTFTQADMDKVLRSIENERKATRTEANKVAKWEALGITPDDVKALMAEKTKAEEDAAKERGDYETLVQQMREKHANDIAERDAENNRAMSAVDRHVRRSALVTALAEAGATQEGLALLPGQYVGRVDVDITGDSPAFTVLTADGKAPMIGTEPGKSATLQDLVGEAVDKFPSLFSSNAKGGGGRDPQAGSASSAKTMTRDTYEELNKNNPSAARQRIRDGWSVTD